ncbi:MAG: hypothetical protein ACOYMG_22150 [Candidatus Methylumidiphilus sp.]
MAGSRRRCRHRFLTRSRRCHRTRARRARRRCGGIGIHGDLNAGQQFSVQEGAQIIYAGQGATIVIGDAPVTMTAVDRQSALGRYLQHLISQNRYLQLQGIRSGGKLVNIELDRI